MGAQNITKEGVLEHAIFSDFESVVILIVFHNVKLLSIIIHMGIVFQQSWGLSCRPHSSRTP